MVVGRIKTWLLLFLIIYIIIINCIYSIDNTILDNSENAPCTIMVTIRKHYFYYDNGVYKNENYYFYFGVYISTNNYKIDNPYLNEIIIYDDTTGTISYLFTDKKIYMSVIPNIEHDKKWPISSLRGEAKYWNTGINGKYLNWNIEAWRKVRYGTKDSKIGMIDTIYYITLQLSFPKAYNNFYKSEEKLYTINSQSSEDQASEPGPTVWSMTGFFNKSRIIKFISIEEVIGIEYINSKESIFKIPDDYKKVEWNPDLFKH